MNRLLWWWIFLAAAIFIQRGECIAKIGATQWESEWVFGVAGMGLG